MNITPVNNLRGIAFLVAAGLFLTTNDGISKWLVPVLCYSENPGQVNSESVRQLFWGRTGPQADATTSLPA